MYHYISETEKAYRLHIKKPDGGLYTKRIAYKKCGGKELALDVALRERERVGTSLWGEFWCRIVDDEKYLLRLPTNDQPILMESEWSRGVVKVYYRVMWTEWINGTGKRKCRKRLVRNRGFDSAYDECREILREVYADSLDIIKYMKNAGNEKYMDWTLQ